MTNLSKIAFGPAFKDFDKFFVGFDSIVDRVIKSQEELAKAVPAYPPFNVKKVDDNHYVIEIACAGFSRNDVDIELDGDKLIITGKSNEDDVNYLYKGIAARTFTRTFSLFDKLEVKNAEMANGMLRITLENLVQANNKVKIAIEDATENARKLLHTAAGVAGSNGK